MGTLFKEFLLEQAKKRQAELEAGKEMVREWQESIERLLQQLRGWLKESDPGGVIEIEEAEQEIEEQGLGRYRVPRLILRVLGKWIAIIPKARRTVGRAQPPRKGAPKHAEGRVDITDEVRRYVLYRFRKGGVDEWFIDGLEQGHDISEGVRPGVVQPVPRYEPQPFDQEAFEKALMSYLR